MKNIDTIVRVDDTERADQDYWEAILNVIGVIDTTPKHAPVKWPKKKEGLVSKPIAKPGDF